MIRSLIDLISFVGIFVVIWSLPIFAQGQKQEIDERRDSLIQRLEEYEVKDTFYLNTLIKLASWERRSDIKTSTNHFTEALSLAQTLKALTQKMKAHNGLGINHGIQQKYQESIHHFQEALKTANEQGDLAGVSSNYNNLGIVYKGLGDYPRSISFYRKSLQIDELRKDSSGVANVCANLGVLFDLMKEPEQAKEYYERALNIRNLIHEPEKIPSLYINLGILDYNQGRYEEALDKFMQAYSYYLERNIVKSISIAEINLGKTYLKVNALDKAKKMLESSLTRSKGEGVNSQIIRALNALADLEIAEGNFSEALSLGFEAKQIADSLEILPLQSDVEYTLAKVYESAGNAELALKHYKDFQSIQDSIFNQQTSSDFKNQQVIMEVQETERKLTDQKLKTDLLSGQVISEKRWKWMLGAASLLFLITGILYFQRYQQRNTYAASLEGKNQQIEEQKREIEHINAKLEKQIHLHLEADKTINYFAASLFGKNSVDDILWDVAKNCIARLGLVDCVIYLVDEERDILVQKAAFGSKTTGEFTIVDPIEIPVGEGIVGTVAQTGQAEIISDTSFDDRYIVDGDRRASELAVPLIHQDRVIGVIDSEHPDKHFFTQHHLDTLMTIASICASKIAQTLADEQSHQALIMQVEAERIKELDQMKSHFFANISHEFRTPLNLILGPLQMHEREIPVREIQMMRRNSKRLLRLVNQLLDLSKLEVGQLKIQALNVDVFKLLRIISSSFTSYASSQNIDFQVIIPKIEHVAYFDPEKLEKICYNLISNAIKFTPKNGQVSFTAAINTHHQLTLTVSDTGVGIADQLQHKLFDRFFQVDSSQTRRFEGTGIGLALTKELVDLLGGDISVVSQEGKGSIFTVVLPLMEADGPEEAEEVLPAIYHDSYNYSINRHWNGLDVEEEEGAVFDSLPLVLMVEDNADLQDYMKAHLATSFQCIQAVDGQEGLATAIERVPDVIITDVMMPEMDGLAMVEQLKSNPATSHIPIILLTARDDAQTKRSGFQFGANQYVAKPFDVIELQARVEGLIQQRDRLREKFSQEIVLKPSKIEVEDQNAQFMRTLLAIIEEHMDDAEFRVEDMQKEIGMSRMQLHRKLKALTGKSTSEFIRFIRLQRAAQLLSDAHVQVADAAYQVGFTHLSYFAKCFKAQFGVAPSAYQSSKV